jgi:hypothetical protein
MKEKINAKEWAKDFNQFMSDEISIRPPAFLTQQIQEAVHRDLYPNLGLIFSKLALIHVLVGSLSLLICSQFGMGRGHVLPHLLMSYGEMACMAACGALFLGLTSLVATLVFSRPELKRTREMGYSPILALGLLSLTVFFCFGADIALSVALVWLLGGLVAGALTMELGLGFRRLAHQHY